MEAALVCCRADEKVFVEMEEPSVPVVEHTHQVPSNLTRMPLSRLVVPTNLPAGSFASSFVRHGRLTVDTSAQHPRILASDRMC